jgi:hypothetical protein
MCVGFGTKPVRFVILIVTFAAAIPIILTHRFVKISVTIITYHRTVKTPFLPVLV